MFVSDVGKAVDGSALQYNIVRVNGQKSVYVGVQKQGGDTNTIAVVDGIRKAILTLRDIPAQLKTQRGLRSIGVRQGSHFHGAARRRHRHFCSPAS